MVTRGGFAKILQDRVFVFFYFFQFFSTDFDKGFNYHQ